MAFYTICGKPDCTNFAHATFVAQFLSERLPNFKYRKIEKSKEDWADFVAQLNKKNGWFMIKSPIIWKEITTWGGKPYLVGGLGEFWEYCYCYYGLESSISRQDLSNLARDNLAFFHEEARANSKEHRTYNAVISIFCGDQIELTQLLLEELITIPYLTSSKGYFVKLFPPEDEDAIHEKDRRSLENIVEYYNSLAIFGSRPVVEIVGYEEGAIANCDLLIFMEDFSRNEGEDMNLWLKRCESRVMMLSELVNVDAKRGLRVVLCNEGPSCFMATCMIALCTVLIPANVVTLSADRGVPVISVISEMTGVPVAKIGAPPVWGFIGINEYIDESNTIFKAHIYRPYKRNILFNNSVPRSRALTAPEDSTLPLGTVVPELRVMSCMLLDSHDDIMQKVETRRKDIEEKLHRKPMLSKLRALKSLLELWYLEEPTDHIISLGVCSNGSHGIPAGIVFSQPCIQDQKRRWKPFQNFPMMEGNISAKIQELVTDTVTLIQTACLDVNNSGSVSEDEDANRVVSLRSLGVLYVLLLLCIFI